MAMTADRLNLLLSFMSAWMVGKVEAPAKANMMDPKAELLMWRNFFLKSKNL